MFTGIIEAVGKVEAIRADGTNGHFRISSPLHSELKVDQSISHNGVCLTVTGLEHGSHWTTAVKETLKRSNLGKLEVGDQVNLERGMLNGGRFDGHIVQGHVDQTAIVKSIKDQNGSWVFEFRFEPGGILVEKGSVCVNGVSLTCFNSRPDSFSVAVIPYTYKQTTFGLLKAGDTVNLEFDIVGKYIQKLLQG